ncbi:MAG: FAD-dependent oxidoreductase [Pseudomonadota bacterium]
MTSTEKTKSIAVVGAGVAGLSAAWRLSETADVTLFEADPRLGGHAHTVVAETPGGATPVDVGFIVFNPPAYPNFTAMLDHLGVADAPADMSFGVSMRGGAFEYAGKTLSSVFATRANIASPKYLRMLTEVARFHREARKVHGDGSARGMTLGEFVSLRRYGRLFREAYLVPMAAAIWSTPAARVLDHPFEAFARFYLNHGLLQVLNLPQWRTVRGGSTTYVEALRERISSAGGEFRSGAPVRAVRRTEEGCVVATEAGEEAFDQVLIATHADAGLRLLDQLDARERDILGAFEYAPNRAVLHSDAALMPKRREAWAAWSYIRGDETDEAAVSVSYWMNALQPLQTQTDVFVSLNPLTEPDPALVYGEYDYDHPMLTTAAVRAQERIWSIQGQGGVWHAGAHLGSGFHEDGLQAGLAAAEAMGAPKRPWTVENESGRIHLGPAGSWALLDAARGASAEERV